MTLLLRGLDCWGYPSGAELKAAGFQATNGYLVGGSAITRAVVEDYTAHDIYVWLTWELSATAPEGGSPVAVSDADGSLAAVEALGLLFDGVAISGTNDSIVTNWYAVQDYFAEWATLLTPEKAEPGIYANSTVTDDIRVKGIPITRFWQTGAGSSGGIQPRPYSHIYQGSPTDPTPSWRPFQAFGRGCDFDAVLLPNAGLVNYHGLWNASPPKPPTKKEKPVDMLAIAVDDGKLGVKTGQTFLLNTESGRRFEMFLPSDIAAAEAQGASKAEKYGAAFIEQFATK